MRVCGVAQTVPASLCGPRKVIGHVRLRLFARIAFGECDVRTKKPIFLSTKSMSVANILRLSDTSTVSTLKLCCCITHERQAFEKTVVGAMALFKEIASGESLIPFQSDSRSTS